jgi:hypothetical protein
VFNRAIGHGRANRTSEPASTADTPWDAWRLYQKSEIRESEKS